MPPDTTVHLSPIVPQATSGDAASLAATGPVTELAAPGSLLVETQRFAVVGEWVIEADLSDAAFRVYALLLRFGNTSGRRMPSRRLLADKLHRSVDSIDRAMRELVSAGIVRVEHRRNGRVNLTNRYHVRTTDPARARAPPATAPATARRR